jgi:hypothetical protein
VVLVGQGAKPNRAKSLADIALPSARTLLEGLERAPTNRPPKHPITLIALIIDK